MPGSVRHACKPFELHVSRSLSMCQPTTCEHNNTTAVATMATLGSAWWETCSTNSNTVNTNHLNHKSTTTTPPFQHDSTVGACDAARLPCEFVCSMLAAMCGLATPLGRAVLCRWSGVLFSCARLLVSKLWPLFSGKCGVKAIPIFIPRFAIIEKKGDICLRFYAQTEQQHSTATEFQPCCFALASVHLSRHSSCGLANPRSPQRCTAAVHGNNMLSGNMMA